MNMPKTLLASLIGLALSVPAQAAEVNVYSGRAEAFIKPLLDQFTEQTGIKVNLVSGKDDALIARLQSEGANSPADLLMTADAGRLYRAEAAQLLQPVVSQTLQKNIPAQYRDPDNTWFGLTLRARPIFYAPARVKPEALKDYAGLTDARWKGRLCVRSSDNIYNQSMVSAMIEEKGPEATENWVRGLVANFARPPKGGDRDQIKAVAAGECDLALANTYYYAGMVDDKDAATRDAAAAVAVFWPDQEARGVHVNISGAGVTRAAKNAGEARQLIEFLSSDAAQKWYAEVNHEYPVKTGVEPSATLRALGSFKADDINLDALGKNNAAAVQLMDRAGWK